MKSALRASPLALLVFVATGTAFADWNKKLDCGYGSVVVDEMCSSYRGVPCYTRSRQLVIHDEDLIREIVSKGGAGYYNYNAGRPYFSYGGRPLIVRIDEERNWGYAGGTSVSLSIPYADTSYWASYYINYQDNGGATLKVWKHSHTRDDIVPQGQLVERNLEHCVRY